MRTVPAQLQAHLDQATTTTCRLLKITLRNGIVYGLCSMDRTLEYDDGLDVVEYVALNGFDSSTISSDSGYSVSNAEAMALISDDVPGITVEMVEAGELDDASWVCYLVNFEDLSMGHIILDAGDLGEVRTRHGLVWLPELLSYMMRLRQPVGSVYSRTCRATFGSLPNSQTGCGIDAEALWEAGEVLSVGEESTRVFVGDATSTSPTVPPPGRVRWLTGANAGSELAIEEFDDGEVVLIETTRYPIQVGDTYEIRPDCRKRYLQDCVGVWDNGPNFKGEPYIPVGDAVAIQAPGGQMPGGGGYVGVDENIEEN